MDVWFDVARNLEARLNEAAADLGWDRDVFEPAVRTADPRFGDFQANGVLPYAKRNKQNPRALAEQLVENLGEKKALAAGIDVSIAGPGFINFKLTPTYLLNWLRQFDSEAHLQRDAGKRFAGRTWVVDYGSPNTAKQMHVGHLRTIIVGESICRLLEFCGAKVIRDNHLGDWGTQFGIILYGYKHFLDPEALARDPLEEFERLYKAANARCKEDPAALEEARAELVRLQQGDPDAVAIWEKVNQLSVQSLKEIYERLDVHYDHYLGESFYRDKVDTVYRELTEIGLAEESEGALVVFHPEHPRFATQPFIIRKRDGASNYATTDLATMLYRVEHFDADGIIIVTDSRQNDHFEQLWLTTRKWFEATGRRLPEFQHVTFGTILGEDGKAIKTRSGDPIRLKALLDEAVERAFAIVTEKNPDLPEEKRREIAERVGIGAVVYADLSQNRTSDYIFSWQKLLSFEGNTAPYLLYACVRIASILRKLPAEQDTPPENASAFETAEEIALARKLAAFPAALDQAVTTLRPHFISLYLYELAGAFSSFYNADRVIVDDPAVRARRLLLCRRTLMVLQTGLHLLTIRPLDQM
ncbi:MAG: arginine--tRNA ligase [Verrucomicrobia bacterium]|nr:MAG: arginine--tRNA ligase [Verrucomicrobiota bacterium]